MFIDAASTGLNLVFNYTMYLIYYKVLNRVQKQQIVIGRSNLPPQLLKICIHEVNS